MTDFDFHNLLFPTEFEKLCRDIVDIRDSPIKFTTYRRGKDGGIDFKSTNTQIKIIGQCKLYNPANYSSFLTSLKNEVKKCKRQNPDRYILCTNIKLSPEQATEIYELFKEYIKEEEDIIDGEKLNKYLSNKKYQHLLKVYSKLLVPNLQFVELALEKIVNKKYYNKTNSFLKQIHKEHKLFHNTQILKHCIDVLEKNRVIILAGNPGVGKTTTAKMIVNYFINQKVENVLFLTDNDLVEVEGLYQENQIIVVDDFWGQNFSPIHRDGTLLRNFNRIVNDFKESKSRYLILTSREYIIKDVLNHSENETRQILNTDRFIVNLDDYSKEDKVRIFLNHILYYDFEKSFFSQLKYGDTLENIIEHPNYSPRHIEYFIKEFLKYEDQGSFNFYHSFKNYLKNPFEYWNNNFNNLNGTSKLILLLLLISSDPIDLFDLEKSFIAVQNSIRNNLNENIEPLKFNKELKILENFYIISEKQNYSNQIFIRFQNPGIKDFLLEYLRTDGKLWIEPLIKNALFFNQLNFIFEVQDEINNSLSNEPAFGKKIILSNELKKILKNKLLTEFDILNFCFQEDNLYEYKFSSKYTSAETKYPKLFWLTTLFDISKDENLDVRNFIFEEVKKDIDTYTSDKDKIVNKHSISDFPEVIKRLSPYVNFDAKYLINCYWESCSSTSEYSHLFNFKEIFPEEFNSFFKNNITAIKKAIKYHIIDDIDYYRWYDMEDELDSHLNYYIEEVCINYKIRLTSKFIEEIEGIAEREVIILSRVTKKKDKKIKKTKFNPKYNFKPKKFEAIVNEYLPDDSNENFNPIQYLKKININKKVINEINKLLHLTKSILDPFKCDKDIFSFFIHWVVQESIALLSYNEFTIVDSFFTYYSKIKGLDLIIFKNIFFELAENSFDNDFSITKTQIDKLFIKYNISHYEIDVLYPIIVTDSKWYKFSSYDFQVYFITEHFSNLKSNKEFKEKVIDYTFEMFDLELLRYLSYKCKDRLNEALIVPELQRLLSNIDSKSPKTIVSSLLDFFKIDYEVEWIKKEKRLEEMGLKDAEFFIELLIQHIGIDFSTFDFSVYLLNDCYGIEHNIQKYFMNKKAYNNLYKYIVTKVPKRNGFTRLTKESTIYFDIKLYELVKDDEFYLILQEVGMENYVLNLYERIKQAMNNLLIS